MRHHRCSPRKRWRIMAGALRLFHRIFRQAPARKSNGLPRSPRTLSSPRGSGPTEGFGAADRDGTLIRDVPYLNDAEKVELLPGVGQGLQELQAAGFALAIVTNQQGIGLGYTTRQEMIAVNQRLFRALAPFGVLISKYITAHTRLRSAATAESPRPQCCGRPWKTSACRRVGQ